MRSQEPLRWVVLTTFVVAGGLVGAEPSPGAPWLAAIRPPLCAPEQPTALRHQLICQDYQQRLDAGLQAFMLINNHLDVAAAIAAVGTTDVAAWGPTFYGNDSVVAEVPVCPAGGTYTATSSPTGPNIACSFLSAPNPHTFPTQPAYPFGLTADEQRWRCQQQQHRLWSAVEQYVLENSLSDYEAAIVVLGTDINGWGPAFFGPDGYLRSVPVCPNGGAYLVDSTDEGSVVPISCSLAMTSPFRHLSPTRAQRLFNTETPHGRVVFCQNLQQQIEGAILQTILEESIPDYDAFLMAYGANVSCWTSTTSGPGKFLAGVPVCPSGSGYLLSPPGTPETEQLVGCTYQDEPHPHQYLDSDALPPQAPPVVDLNGTMTGYDWCAVYELGGGSVPLVERTTAYATRVNSSPDYWGFHPAGELVASRNQCQERQYRIDSAAQQYTLEQNLADRDAFIAQLGTTLDSWPGVIAGPGLILRRVPVCPDGGTYTLQSPGGTNACPVRCSFQTGSYPHIYPDICSQTIPPTPTPAPVVVATTFMPPDPEAIIDSMVFVLENAVESGEVLTLAPTPGISISGSNTGLIVATGPAPVRRFVEAMRTLRYDFRPTTQPPPAITGTRTVRVVASANGVPGEPAYASVVIAPGSSFMVVR